MAASRVGVVKSSWFSWFPQAGWNAGFWVEVAKLVRLRRVRTSDREAVVRVCREVWNIQRGK